MHIVLIAHIHFDEKFDWAIALQQFMSYYQSWNVTSWIVSILRNYEKMSITWYKIFEVEFYFWNMDKSYHLPVTRVPRVYITSRFITKKWQQLEVPHYVPQISRMSRCLFSVTILPFFFHLIYDREVFCHRWISVIDYRLACILGSLVPRKIELFILSESIRRVIGAFSYLARWGSMVIDSSMNGVTLSKEEFSDSSAAPNIFLG